MADYIDGEYIADFPDKESLEDSDFFIMEDSEATKKTTLKALKDSTKDKVSVYFGISSNAKRPPTHDPNESSILGNGILGSMILGDSAEWTEEFPTNLYAEDYVWVSYYIEHPDGTDEWSAPFCLMDQIAKESIEGLTKEVEDLKDELKQVEALLSNTLSVG